MSARDTLPPVRHRGIRIQTASRAARRAESGISAVALTMITLLVSFAACGSPPGGADADSAVVDAAGADASVADAAVSADAATVDASAASDASSTDAAATVDGATVDAPLADASQADAALADASQPDATVPDAAPPADAGPPADAQIDAVGGIDLPSLSDTFDQPTLDPSWYVFRPQEINVTVSNGSLHLVSTQRSLWYQRAQGPLVYKQVSGDFKVSTIARARRASDFSQPPFGNVHLGGLMARVPRPEGASVAEDYVLIAVGWLQGLQTETKSTTAGVSSYQGTSAANADAELRICRVGSKFHLYSRPLGTSTWQLALTYDRPDLPDTLQVGPQLCANDDPTDLEVAYEHVTFGAVTTIADCITN